MSIIERVSRLYISRDCPDVTYYGVIYEKKIREWNTFRTSNLNHCVLQAILHLEVVYIWNPRVEKITFSFFVLLQYNSVPHKHLELLFISFGSVSEQWWIQRGLQGCTGTPLQAAPSTKKFNRLNGTLLSGYRTKKIAAMAHLRMLQKKFVLKQIDWTGRVGSWSQKRSKWAWFSLKVGVASKNLRTLRMQQ